MIRFKTGDLLAEDAEALVNTINCVGVMGRGIALQFKKTFPENFRVYAEACKRGEVRPGRMFVFETGKLTNPRYIINFPTKRHWRDRSRIEDVDDGLINLAETIRERGIRSIAVPPLGSGLGGLNWSDVRLRIEETLGGFVDLRVVVFEPRGEPEANVERRRKMLRKVLEDFEASGVGLRMSENLTREELYDRARARAEAKAAKDAPDAGTAGRLGFLSDQFSVPEDFDSMGAAELEALFEGRAANEE